MDAHLFLHVRTLPSGRVVATPVPFNDLGVDCDSAAEARTQARAAATERLDELSGGIRAALTEAVVADLSSVRVRVAPERSAEGVDLTVGLVILVQATNAGEVHVAYVPGMHRWSVAAGGREPVLALAKRSLEDALAQWPPGPLLSLDESGEVELEPLDLPLPVEESADGPELPGDDMTALSAEGRLGRLDRRDPLVERVLAVLAADGRASVLLVGPSDVGKSTLVHEIAARLGSGDVPPALRGRRLLRISANELIAGAKFTGMWQERARELIGVARETGAIVAMGDPNGIVDAGRWSESDNNLGRVLRPYMERGELRLICEATPDGVASARKWEPSFIEVFYRVDVPEPGLEAAREILRAAARRIEANHAVPFDEEAAQAALELTRRFEPYRALPGKAVRLLEETAQLTAVDSAERLGRDAVTQAFAARTGMPLSMLSDRVPLHPHEVRAFFEERVLGQDEAVEAMVDLIAVIKAALNDPAKPLSTLLFVGPTGVGKTELTKALAEFLFGSRERVLRFDMGEYAGGDALPRLVGSAWERDGEGELTSRVREQPFCVLLLDEIEKAHHGIFDVLLSALGEARVTDASGRTADLRNAIVIMTSNLGASRQESGSVGFARETGGQEGDRRRSHFVGEAERFFRPEFFNRIDRVLAFDPLDRETIRTIARREIGRLLLREGITRRQLLVEIDDGVVERLADEGFHPRYGARPLHREIERAVIRPLARLIVEQRAAPGDLIRLEDADGSVALSIHRVREPTRPRRPPRHAHAAPDATLARAAARAEALHEEVLAEHRAPIVVSTGEELSTLLARVNGPGFWDDSATAKAILARVYQLQRVRDGLASLRTRSEGLVELAHQLRTRRDRRRLGELRDALAEIEDRLAIARLECAGAAAGVDDPEAIMSFTPVGAEAGAWAEALAAMYATWAQRSGRDVIRARGDARRLTITGPGSYPLLAGEAGLHRRDLRDRTRQLARVQVVSGAADAHGGEERPGGRHGDIVRVYAEGARTGVRDPRTGISVGNVGAVLEEGQIDEFILAAVALRDTPR